MALLFEFFQRPRQVTRFKNMIIHAKGFWAAIVQMFRERIARQFSATPVSFLLLQASLTYIQSAYFFNDSSQIHKELEIWKIVMEGFEPLLTLVSQFGGPFPLYYFWELQALEECLSLGLDAFMARKKFSANVDSESFHSGIQNILKLSRHVVELVYEFPGGREMLELAEDPHWPSPWAEDGGPPLGWDRI